MSSLEHEFSVNAKMLKMCNGFYNFAFIAYLFIFIWYIVIALHDSSLFLAIDTIVAFSLAGYMIFMGMYKKHNLCAVGVPIVFGFNQIFVWGSASHFLIFVFSIVIGAINLIANAKYHWLEEQVGFPYFNVRNTEREIEKIQRDIKDDFQQQREYWEKNSSDDMDDVFINHLTSLDLDTNLKETAVDPQNEREK